MKKIKYLLLIIIFSLSQVVNAATATYSLTSNYNSVSVGNKVTFYASIKGNEPLGVAVYEVLYDSNYLTFVSGSPLRGTSTFTNTNTRSFNYQFVFKTKKTGSTKVSFRVNQLTTLSEKLIVNSSNPKLVAKTINISMPRVYSSNNYLRSLSTDVIKINFNKNTLKYSGTVNYNVNKIKINATLEDTKASLSGTGDHNLKVGDNKFIITARAENGATRKYEINVKKESAPPILVTYNNEEYTLSRILDDKLNPSNSFIKKQIDYNNEKVDSFYNEVTNTTLLELKKDNLSYLLIYKDNTFHENKYFKSNGIELNILDKKVLDFDNKQLTYNDMLFKCYIKDNYCYFYAINYENNKEGLYRFEEDEKTVQLEHDNLKEEVRVTDRRSIYYYIGFIVGIGFVIAMLLILYFKRKKVVKKKDKKK